MSYLARLKHLENKKFSTNAPDIDPPKPPKATFVSFVSTGAGHIEKKISVHSRDEALRLSHGAVEATPIPSFCATTRVEIPADLARLINAMGQYWNYSSDDYETAFQGARSDPEAWWVLCLEDQRRFGWELPKVQSPGDIEQAVTEATEERRAILEHEAKLRAEQADAITKLAADFYRHLFGVAYETRCCKPRCNTYCVEGRRLHDAYCGATS